jgi:hypothetical protein
MWLLIGTTESRAPSKQRLTGVLTQGLSYCQALIGVTKRAGEKRPEQAWLAQRTGQGLKPWASLSAVCGPAGSRALVTERLSSEFFSKL